jgi:glc operon protein GlcG
MKTMRPLAAIALAVSLAGPAAADLPPPPTTEASPPYGTPITLAQAKKIAAAAEAEALKAGAGGAVIAIVQPDGSLVYFEKLDLSTYVSIEFAQEKARTAAITRHATGGWGPKGGDPSPVPSLIALPGGLPIVVDGKTIGAIGVSGAEAPGTNDVKVAEAALAALK